MWAFSTDSGTWKKPGTQREEPQGDSVSHRGVDNEECPTTWCFPRAFRGIGSCLSLQLPENCYQHLYVNTLRGGCSELPKWVAHHSCHAFPWGVPSAWNAPPTPNSSFEMKYQFIFTLGSLPTLVTTSIQVNWDTSLSWFLDPPYIPWPPLMHLPHILPSWRQDFYLFTLFSAQPWLYI